MSLLNEVDARADELLRDDSLTQHDVWRELCVEFPGVHSNTIAERVAASIIDNGGTINV